MKYYLVKVKGRLSKKSESRFQKMTINFYRGISYVNLSLDESQNIDDEIMNIQMLGHPLVSVEEINPDENQKMNYYEFKKRSKLVNSAP